MERTSYIYALLCPDLNQIRYVGRSEDPVQRLKAHINESRRSYENPKVQASPKDEWIHELTLQDKTPVLAILEEVTIRIPNDGKELPAAAERRWLLRCMEEGAPLLNSEALRREPTKEVALQQAIERGKQLFG